MRRLSGLDAAMVYAETPAMPMHGGTLTILDPSTAAEPFDAERFRATVAGRLHRLAPFRQRLASPPLGAGRPFWVEDPDVDLRAHVRGVAVPRPGTPRQLGELVGYLLALPLPRDRPLWQMWVIEGLEGGHVGLFGKVHHALLGGTRATALFELVYDLEPVALPGVATLVGGAAEREPSGFTVAAHAALELAGTPLRLARLGVEGILTGTRVARFLASSERADAVLPYAGPRTSFNGALAPARSCAFGSLSLRDVKAVKDVLGVTVNDVVLAVCGGALRRCLEERGELPDRSLTAAAPVSVAGPDDSGVSVLGNMLSVFGATLATDVEDPVERVRRVHASTVAAKSLHRALGEDLLLDLAGAAPPGLVHVGVRAYSSSGVTTRFRPPFNVIVSNLPGPATTLYSGGARVLAFHILGPTVEGVSVNISVVSYRNSLDVGVVSSPHLLANPWEVTEAMPPVLAQLRTALAHTA